MSKLYCNKLKKYITLRNCDNCEYNKYNTITECRGVNVEIR